MTTDNFRFYLQNRIIQTSLTGGQRYSDASPFSIPWRNCQRQRQATVTSVLALATLGGVTEIGLILFVSCHPR
jgi:hypothetical protein